MLARAHVAGPRRAFPERLGATKQGRGASRSPVLLSAYVNVTVTGAGSGWPFNVTVKVAGPGPLPRTKNVATPPGPLGALGGFTCAFPFDGAMVTGAPTTGWPLTSRTVTLICMPVTAGAEGCDGCAIE